MHASDLYNSNDENRELLEHLLIVGIILYPLFSILDYIVYRKYFFTFLGVRIFVVLFLLLIKAALRRYATADILLFIILAYWSTSFGISLMIFFTNEGFRSHYYAGIMLIVVASSIYYGLRPLQYYFVLGITVVPHFLLLSVLRFEWSDVVDDILFLGGASFIALINYRFVHRINESNAALVHLLSMCAWCRKIKNQEGEWNSLEAYIQKQTQSNVTHGICPECAEKYKQSLMVAKIGHKVG